MSQPSLGGTTERDEEISPPPSPLLPTEGTSAMTSNAKQKQNLHTQKSAPTYVRKYQDSSLEADDTESELVAIPESDASESTLNNNSTPGSFDDPLHLDEYVQPLKMDQAKGKVTTANLATAQVALTTIGVAERERNEEVRNITFFFVAFLIRF